MVSNRLPVRLDDDGGRSVWRASPGGLVSALTPVLRGREGVWIGWPGHARDVPHPATHEGIALHGVPISADEYDDFYVGFANRTLWPLYHDAIRSPSFDRHWWQAYVRVNHRYAEAAATAAAPDATVWVHDYHLQLVPMMLRALRPDVRIGFFLHIPFPPQELFVQLPWRREILEGLLGADLIGFQVPGAASNFARLARRLTDAVECRRRAPTRRSPRARGRVPDLDRRGAADRSRGRSRRRRNVRAEIRRDLGDPDVVLLGVDRLDYTKGIEQRVRAIAELFAEGVLDDLTARHGADRGTEPRGRHALPARARAPRAARRRGQRRVLARRPSGDSLPAPERALRRARRARISPPI